MKCQSVLSLNKVAIYEIVAKAINCCMFYFTFYFCVCLLITFFLLQLIKMKIIYSPSCISDFFFMKHKSIVNDWGNYAFKEKTIKVAFL